ncbi:MAG: cytochrome c [Hyphomicrobiales bacterium]|nr:cytochrome c [Hyphomicrobiales bacterium]MCP4997784.1 cytochrome c [Hyphomicrobiales bacterium]
MANRAWRAGWLLLAGIALAGPAAAQDAKAGRDKAQMCVVCHGVDGIAVAPNAPNLAGENAAYIVAQLEAFRSGKRTHEQMSIIAADLQDADIADLARWYSLIKVVATPPDLD